MPWTAVVPAALARQATGVAIQVTGRLDGAPVAGSPDLVEAAAGVAVLHSQLDRLLPGNGWDARAHGCLAIATEVVKGARIDPAALFGGLGGVAYAAWSLSRDGSRYRRMLAELDTGIADTARVRAESLAASPRNRPLDAFDVVSGLAGTGRYLLCRQDDPRAEHALRTVLVALVALCGATNDVPHWFTPAAALAAETPIARQFPGGVLNCGLAHGIPGPLALLSIAARAGIQVPGQAAAIEHVAGWLVAQRADDEWGANWPYGVALPTGTGPVPRPRPTQAAWCYGSPGVARALWLAGVALDDEKLRTLAVESMLAVYRRPWSARSLGPSPGLCHGVAGLLQITLRFAHDTHEPAFGEAAAELVERLVDMYEPERPVGYYAIGPQADRADRQGLLDGAAGVALALLAATTDVPPDWDRLLLLS